MKSFIATTAFVVTTFAQAADYTFTCRSVDAFRNDDGVFVRNTNPKTITIQTSETGSKTSLKIDGKVLKISSSLRAIRLPPFGRTGLILEADKLPGTRDELLSFLVSKPELENTTTASIISVNSLKLVSLSAPGMYDYSLAIYGDVKTRTGVRSNTVITSYDCK